ncbi:MAG TPA: GYD domain-containing protein [Phycisphaerae bacterium]|jgi:uncharacterized protein with GYD domain
MNKYVILWRWTEKGVASFQQSPDRAETFLAAAKKLGIKIDAFLWTTGNYDGIVIAEAPDDQTISALALSTAKLGNITTCTARAYDLAEFRKVVGKVS